MLSSSIVKKYLKGRLQSTLKRELNALEFDVA